MKKELEEILYNKYPKLFADKDLPETISLMSYGCAIGDGWYNIMNNLCWMIQNHVDYQQRKNPEYKQVEFFQIKEKFGSLRVYTKGNNDEVVNALINFAEVMASNTCELCGNLGKIRSTGWRVCRCNDCQREFLKTRGIVDKDEEDRT